jgi:hypothetical protein
MLENSVSNTLYLRLGDLLINYLETSGMFIFDMFGVPRQLMVKLIVSKMSYSDDKGPFRSIYRKMQSRFQIRLIQQS